MKINGHEIAEQIYVHLRKRVGELQKKGVTPHLMVILVGDNPGSIAYVNQKELSGTKVGAKVTIKRFPETVTNEEIKNLITELNEAPAVHGILLQRPLPSQMHVKELELLTNPQKDIDGFHPDSTYVLPLPLAIIKILLYIYQQIPSHNGGERKAFMEWLANQKIVLIGKGETGGEPIRDYLHKLKLNPQIIDSKTSHPENVLKKADIVISAVGKPDIIKPDYLKQGVILLGVGMTKGEGKKLHGDYDEESIKNIASFYTPTPKGVGPVNVAMLLDNLITAAERQT